MNASWLGKLQSLVNTEGDVGRFLLHYDVTGHKMSECTYCTLFFRLQWLYVSGFTVKLT